MGIKVASKHIAPALETEDVKRRRMKGGKKVLAPAKEQRLAHKTGPLETPERSSGSRSWATVLANTLRHKETLMNEDSTGPSYLKNLLSPVLGLRVTDVGEAKGGLSWSAENIIAKNEVAPRVLGLRILML
ncbi:unnamed protein product [Echinostoma caproni]|uniref:Uncharacterized protein n=1 Tax=Echinostoma caproni TaxID=27848 RepID=A0A183BA61_9TREM|nr:unnamed protein product [Echinostoma caproni]